MEEGATYASGFQLVDPSTLPPGAIVYKAFQCTICGTDREPSVKRGNLEQHIWNQHRTLVYRRAKEKHNAEQAEGVPLIPDSSLSLSLSCA